MQPQTPMLCSIENEKIMQLDYAGRPVKELGVITAQYQEALKVASGYKEKLIEAGIIKKEKTVQELQEEQNEMLKALLGKVETLEKKVKDYEHRTDTPSNKKNASEK